MTTTTIGSLISYGIKIKGSAIDDTIQVHAIHVEQSINRISTAMITILDGSPSKEKFPVSASDTFVPGNAVTIEAGYNNTNSVLFTGIITKQSVRVHNSTGPMLLIECKDEAIKMTVGRKSSAYSKKKDSDVISTLIGNSSLSSDVTATTVVIPELVQYYTTDWDFMLARAEVNSMIVSTLNGKVSVFDPTSDTSSVTTLTYGDNLYDINADLNSVSQLAQVKASAWDYQNQKLITAEASNSLAGPGNISSKTLSDVVGLSTFELQTTAAETTDELTSWAKAQMLKSELSKITGDLRMQGCTTITPGKYVTIDGVGARFDGDHFVSAARHDIIDGNWFTELNIGLDSNWFIQEHEVEAPPAAGLLPGIQGLFTGVVQKIDSDPDSEYRIQVEVALFNDNGEGLWARLSNFYSTSGQGVFFLPEVGDEVILGFLNEDPRYPVILGSLYSQKNKPYSDFTPNEKNSIKGIVSKSELRVMFDDENKVLTLITPNKNTIELSDKDKQISIKDENSNSIVMSSSGIEIKSPKDITISATQAVSVKGSTGVSVEASGGDVSVKGINVKEEASAQYSAKGGATAQVEGSATLTLKGGMVMIN